MTPPSLAPEADAALQACRRELAEALEQQAATREILGVISRLPADPQPVFEAIVAAGVRLFGDAAVAISRPDGDMVRPLAIAEADSQRRQRWARVFPFPLSREYIHGAALLDCRVVDVPDLLEPGGPFEVGKRNVAPSGYRAMAVVPLLREGRAVGAIAVVRVTPGRLSERQLAMLQTFADQALIAIENARLFKETHEALERQTATSAILRVISESPSDVQPVLDAVAERTAALCGSTVAAVFQLDGDMLRPSARYSRLAEVTPGPSDLVPLRRSFITGRACLDRAPVHIADIVPLLDDEFADVRENQRRFGFRAVLAVPLLREGRAVGALFTWRPEPRPFSDEQIALLETFADQAVIAIENTRLSREREARNRELAEALEQQTATGEILRVIARSPTDVQPVFDTIAQAALRLCQASIVNVLTFDGELLHVGALAGLEPRGEAAARAVFPRAPGRETVAGMAVLTRDVFVIEDVLRDQHYVFKAGADWRLRSALGLPLLREGQPIGALAICRPLPGPFDAKLVALLRTFADQAVIALENTRLFTELQDKTRELQVANRHKSAFLANMSHELRTPLNAILGFTRIVLRETRAQVPPKQAENLEKILASARHLVGLINATLDLTRIEAGRIEITPSDLALAPLLRECLLSVEPLAADGVSLGTRVAADLPTLRVDVEKLHQILLNLLGNAVKFTERGRIELRARSQGDCVAIEIEDTGIGIPHAKLEAVFEEFEQVDAGHARAHGGTGLGLAIARRLARAMRGDLTAVSELGRGSTFTLTLPLRWRDADEP